MKHNIGRIAALLGVLCSLIWSLLTMLDKKGIFQGGGGGIVSRSRWMITKGVRKNTLEKGKALVTLERK